MAGVRKVQPFPSNGTVEPWTGELRLGANELPFFDSLVSEHIRISGTDVKFFSIDMENTVRDEVYDEVVEYKFLPPYELKMYVNWYGATNMAGEEGFRSDYSCEGYVSRAELDLLGAPAPKEGDVIFFWDIPFFTDYKVAGSGNYFDIINANDAGHLFDNAAFVGFTLVLKKRTEYAPDRKITP